MFNNLPPELCESLIAVAQENVDRTRKFYHDALEWQRVARQQKEEIMMERKLDQAQEELNVAIYFYKCYHPPHCCELEDRAKRECKKFKVKCKNSKLSNNRY